MRIGKEFYVLRRMLISRGVDLTVFERLVRSCLADSTSRVWHWRFTELAAEELMGILGAARILERFVGYVPPSGALSIQSFLLAVEAEVCELDKVLHATDRSNHVGETIELQRRLRYVQHDSLDWAASVARMSGMFKRNLGQLAQSN